MTGKLLCFDLETTGVDPYEDKIVQLAALRIEPVHESQANSWARFKVVSRFVALYNPGRHIPEGATAQHGISDADVAGKPAFEADAAIIQELIRGATLIGYNLRRFDSIMLDAELIRSGQPGLEKDDLGRIVQPELDVWRVWTEQEPRTLTGALWRFRKERLEDAHQADADAEATVKVLDAMFGCWTLGLDDMIALSCPEGEVDRAGKLKVDDDGCVCLAFGKHDGTRCQDVSLSYLKWMAKAGFPDETMNILRRLYAQGYPKWEDLT